MDDAEDVSIAPALALMSAASGIQLSSYKTATMRRRIDHRMAICGIASHEDYVDRLATDADERAALLDALLIKTTEMFRHPPTMALLRERALPALFERRHDEGAKAVRAWVVGTSTGEEAFTLAMCLREAAERHPGISTSVIATDVDEHALASTRNGLLAPGHVAGMPEAIAARWLTREENGYRVDAEIRAMVTTEWHDIVGSEAPAPRSAVLASFDLVSCRNVLIYLRRAAQERVLSRLCKSCAPNGILMLGEAEAVTNLDGAVAYELGLPMYEVDSRSGSLRPLRGLR